MKLLSFVAKGNIVRPAYCSLQIKDMLPFEHGRVKIVESDKFGEEVKNGKTILHIRPGAGANEAPAFKVSFPSACRDAIRSLRAACCAKVYLTEAKVSKS